MRAFRLILLSLLLLVASSACGSAPAPGASAPPPTAAVRSTDLPHASADSAGRYDIGAPALMTDLWVDPVHGADSHSGASRDQALRTISAAWNQIPTATPLTNGYRIWLVAGDYTEDYFPVYWEQRYGTQTAPIIIQSADGPLAARLQGSLNVYDVRYLYWIDLEVRNAGDVFHCELCDHLLLRGVRFDGGNRQAHETIKVNQSRDVYIEDSDIGGSYENAIDFVAVQYGHIVGNRIHTADDWCIYLKGGSAYYRIEGNEIYDCGTGGFTAGQGTGFEYMVSPWLHYEAYDLKFINNVVHDTEGAGFGVNGGYNILLAYNTLYRVGTRSHGMEFVFGLRTCDGDTARCSANQSAGGWGTANSQEEPIPNRNLYVFNNILYNPAGVQSQWQHFAIYGPRQPSPGSNIPAPARTDDNLQIRGNLIWNGPADLPLGIEGGEACQAGNPTCNADQLRADNAINTIEPALVDPAHGDFRPVAGGSVFGVTTFAIPAFPAWASLTPPVPAGNLDNTVATDRAGNPRTASGPPGAYTGQDAATFRRSYLPLVVSVT
ncbi:MAG: right-handed parallel beta-helix repeat-containing protein [Anaerolineae bacterium]|jgi:hypothetical protein